PFRERRRQLRQGAERPCDAEPLLPCARWIAHHALEVVERGDHAERTPDLQRLRLAQPARLFGIEACTSVADPAQCMVHGLPVEPRARLIAGALRRRLDALCLCLRCHVAVHGCLLQFNGSARSQRSRTSCDRLVLWYSMYCDDEVNPLSTSSTA